ncbi:hypothetical protein CEXT_601231 [Caerostris extrusa]|uniref:Galectin n=1 Tax=Caerostris extrusa TaxID=172846 RepID=A0AAV4TTH2_CAEEX|nr:hypothetical protein CEXT_601231 [Caerostris extrusa]
MLDYGLEIHVMKQVQITMVPEILDGTKVLIAFFIAHDRTVKLEVFDECAFSLDEKIAYGSYDIPKSVLLGKTVNEWIELSGKLGENKEGSINIVITCQPIPTGTLIYHPKSAVTVIPYGTYAGKKNLHVRMYYPHI